MHYGDDRLAAYVDDVQRSDRVTGKRVVNEAVRWGMSRRRAGEIVAGLLGRAAEAAAKARDETPGLPPELPRTIEAQLARLTGEMDT